MFKKSKSMKSKIFIIAIIAISFFTNINAQKLTGEKLSFLKGQKTLHIVFDYSDLKIQNNSESTALAMRGEEWAAQWEEAKSTTFNRQFLAHLNKNLNVNGDVLLVGNYPEAHYQATVRVLSFGSVWGVECEVVFTKNNDLIPLTKISVKGDSRRIGGIGGMGSNTYLAGSAMSFAGQNLGRFMVKKIK